MKYKIGVFLLVLFLTSACSFFTGKAAQNATQTVSPTNTIAAALPGSPTPSLALSMPAAAAAASQTSTARTGSTSSEKATASPTFTPFPSASPTALPLPTRVERAAPTATPGGATQTPEPAGSLFDQYLPRRVKAAETEHFVFYTQDGYMPVDLAWWTAQAEEVYGYVSQRLDGSQVKHKIQLALQPPDKEACPVRGLASEGSEPMIVIFAGKDSSQAYLLGVLSHEVGHAISYEGFPHGLPGNIALAEGIASWGSGKYWAVWKNVASIDDLVRGYLLDGTYESIHENTDLSGVYPWQKNTGPGEDCLARRDKLYTEWASFTGYLIDTYGWPKAFQLFRSPAPLQQPGQTIYFPPDYQGIYGKTLNQLEWEWLREIDKP